MLDERADAELRGIVRTGQIIVLACGGGVLMFAAYILLAAAACQRGQQFDQLGIRRLGGGWRFPGPADRGAVMGSGLRRIADGTWASARSQTPARDGRRPSRCGLPDPRDRPRAFFEGPSFLGLFAYMTEGHLAGLIVAAVMLVGLSGQFPTPGRVAAWVETHLRWIEDTRQLGRS